MNLAPKYRQINDVIFSTKRAFGIFFQAEQNIFLLNRGRLPRLDLIFKQVGVDFLWAIKDCLYFNA